MMLAFARLDIDEFAAIDPLVSQHLIALQNLGTVEIFLAITVLGSTLGILLVTLAVAYFLRRNLNAVFKLFFLIIGAGATMGIAKTFVERARPDVLAWLDPLSSFSFPSGHATLTTALYGFIAVESYRRGRARTAKSIGVILPVFVIILVALSRMVLSAHYFTDVIAGVLLGLFWLSVIYMLPRIRLGI